MIDRQLISSKEENQSRFFYGYIIVLVSFLILIITGGSGNSFGVFFKPLLTEFGWDRATTSGAYSLYMLISGVGSIFAGRLSDKFGPRSIITVCGLMLGLGYLLMSRVNAIWQIYLFFGVIAGVGMGGIAIPLLSNTARWFSKRRGLATGIVISGTGIGTAIVPPLANLFISRFSWRTSYLILGSLAVVLIVLLAQFLRHAPNQNSFPNPESRAAKKDRQNLQVRGLTFREAIYTRQLWIMCAMYLSFGFGMQMILVHIVAHATDIGFSAAVAAFILSIVGVVCVTGEVAGGSIGDKIGARNAMIAIFILMSLSFSWLLLVTGLWMLYLFAVIFGLGYGGFATTQSTLVADLFGLRSHGAIFGLATAFGISIGGSLGSLVAGRIFDITGSYNWAFILCALLSIISLILSILLKAAPKKL